MFKIAKAIVVAISGLLFLPTFSCQAELAVIAHPTLEITRVSQKEIYRLYTGKTRMLNNKTKVVVLDQKSGSPSRKAFFESLMQSSEPQMKVYWSSRILAGRASPLQQEKDDSAIKDLVAKEPGYIGYIDASIVDDTVKVIYTVREVK